MSLPEAGIQLLASLVICLAFKSVGDRRFDHLDQLFQIVPERCPLAARKHDHVGAVGLVEIIDVADVFWHRHFCGAALKKLTDS